MRVGRADVLVHVPQARPRQDRGARAGEGAADVGGDEVLRLWDVDTRAQREQRVARRVEEDVVGDVAEVPLVADPVAGPEARPPVARQVPREADPGSEVVPVGPPQASRRALGGGPHATVPDLLGACRALAVVEVRVEARVGVLLHAVALVAQTQVELEPGAEAPRVVEVERPLGVAVVAREIGLAEGQGDDVARVLALGIHRRLEELEVPEHQVVE
jgi:hypothetical protein